MKKTLFAFMALAAAFVATSCQNDEEFAQQPTNKPMVINAMAEGIGTGTRATMAYKYDILWSENDEIYVKSSEENATFTLTTGQGTTNGTFECTESPFTSGDAVEAFYPATLIDNGNLVWPAEQTSTTVVPMYSKNTISGTSTENFSFASLGAMLQIVFNTKQENVTLKSITIKDDTNPLSGTFTVNGDGKAAMAANTDAPGITYDLGETGKALGDGANYFNIAVPAGTYSNLSITFTATDESTCTLKGGVTINHNTVGKLTLTGKEFKAPKPDIAPEGFVDIGVAVGGDKIYFTGSPMGASNPWEAGDYCILTKNSTTGEYEVTQRYIYPTSSKESASIPSNTRMPTKEEYEALASAVKAGAGTTWFWVTKNTSNPTTYETWGGWAYVPEGATAKMVAYAPNMNGGYIGIEASEFDKIKFFIPAAGVYDTYGSYYTNSGNYYWSSTKSGSEVYYLSFSQNGISVTSGYPQSKGYPTLLVYKTSE